MTPEDLFEGFDPPQYREEAERRWGETDAYEESARRTSAYTPEDWTRIKAEEGELLQGLAELMQTGAPADGEAARAFAERHRLHIDRWFYPCGHAQHARLAQMYVADDRFRAAFDRHGEGLAAYLSLAIAANAAASE